MGISQCHSFISIVTVFRIKGTDAGAKVEVHPCKNRYRFIRVYYTSYFKIGNGVALNGHHLSQRTFQYLPDSIYVVTATLSLLLLHSLLDVYLENVNLCILLDLKIFLIVL